MSQKESVLASKEQLFTATDMARFCSVDLKTIHNWCAQGKVGHFRTPGRHLRFRGTDALQFLRKYGYPLPPALAAAQPRVFVLSPLANEATELTTEFVDEFEFVHQPDPMIGIARAMGALDDRADALIIIPPLPGFVCDGLPKRLRDGGASHIPCFGYCVPDQKGKALIAGAHAVIDYGNSRALVDVLRRSLGMV